MRPRFHIDQRVVTVKAIRNDGTYPDPDLGKGAVLVPRGTPGYVVDIGTFLRSTWSMPLFFENGRMVGCLERELAPLEEGRAGEDLETGAVLGSAPVGREGAGSGGAAG